MLFDIPNFNSKSTEVFDSSEGSIDPEEELQLNVTKASAGELI